MQLKTRQKTVIAFVIFALLFSSVLTLAYANLGMHQPAISEMPTSPSFQIHVNSPLDNSTYGTYNGPQNITAEQAAHQTTYSLVLPLNITGNQKTSKIAYSLDGSDNITFTEKTTATLTLSYGVHNLTAYATNIEGIPSQSSISFTVGYDYPPINKITTGQIPEAISYFGGRGLKVQVEATDGGKWQNIGGFLSGGAVDFVSKENFADAVTARGIDTIWLNQNSSHVYFYTKVYGSESSIPGVLPIFYGYSAAVV
jgi:hypothetical protein